MPLHWKIAIGFFAGLLLGMVVHYGIGADAAWVQTLTNYVTQPFATMFLTLIFMLIVPLLFSALVVGVAEMGDIRALGRIGWKTLAYTVVVSGIAVVLGLVLVNLASSPAPASIRRWRSNCWRRAPSARRPSSATAPTQPRGPRHADVDRAGQRGRRGGRATPILALMFFALMFGIGLVLTQATPRPRRSSAASRACSRSR